MKAIVFAAGLSGVAASVADVEGHLIGNALPWLNLLESSPAGAHLVLFSSQLVYGPARSKPFSEHERLSPASPYALHQVLLEGYGRLFAASRQLQVTVLRLGNVFGQILDVTIPRSHGVVARMLANLVRDGVARLYGDGSQLVELLDVRDVARATEMVLSGRLEPGRFSIYNIAGHPMSVREMAETLRHGLGRGSIVTEAWPAASREALARDVRLDDSRFRAAYNWIPKQNVRLELDALARAWRFAL